MDYSRHWRDSLTGLGNVTYHGVIPAKAITRIAFVEQKTNHDLVMVAGLDPTITLLNYHLIGGKYRTALKRLFGEAVEEENDIYAQFRTPEQNVEYQAAMEKIWSTGIEVRALQ